MKRDDVAEQIVESVFGEDPALEVFRNEAGFVGFEVFAPGVGFQVVGQTVDIDLDGLVVVERLSSAWTAAAVRSNAASMAAIRCRVNSFMAQCFSRNDP